MKVGPLGDGPAQVEWFVSAEMEQAMLSGLISRDPDRLRPLSVSDRWEFTRRHPYYLLHWQSARDAADNLQGSSENGLLSVATLAVALGWRGEYPPPGVTGDEIRQQAEREGVVFAADLSCAFPVTFRTLLSHIVNLPEELREKLAHILRDGIQGATEIGDDDSAKTWWRRRAAEAIQDPRLDEMVRGLIAVSPDAPLRGIDEDVKSIVKHWEEGGVQVRRREEKFRDYLAVWDLLEGWTGDTYEATAEKRLRDVAQIRKQEVATIQNQHKSAFRYITGQEYTPELWSILFLPVKQCSRLASWRKSKPRTNSVDSIPETRLRNRTTPDGWEAGAGILSNTPDPQSGDPQAWAEMAMDIKTLLEKGRTREEISTDLECPQALIDYFCDRSADGL